MQIEKRFVHLTNGPCNVQLDGLATSRIVTIVSSDGEKRPDGGHRGHGHNGDMFRTVAASTMVCSAQG